MFPLSKDILTLITFYTDTEMKKTLTFTIASLLALACFAETNHGNATENKSIEPEFPTEETHEPGFLGAPINQAIERGMQRADREMEYK